MLGCLGWSIGAVFALGVLVITALVLLAEGEGPEDDLDGLLDGWYAPLDGVLLAEKPYDPDAGALTLNTAQGVRVTLPAGLTTAPATLKVLPVRSPPESTHAALQGGAAYEILLDQHLVFSQPLTLEFEADEAMLAEAKHVAPIAAWWDVKQKTWHTADSVFDEASRTVKVQTEHLTVWRLYYIARGYAVDDGGPHFSIVWDEDESFVLNSKSLHGGDYAGWVRASLVEIRKSMKDDGFRSDGRENVSSTPPMSFGVMHQLPHCDTTLAFAERS